jgi:hypothetical protein
MGWMLGSVVVMAGIPFKAWIAAPLAQTALSC